MAAPILSYPARLLAAPLLLALLSLLTACDSAPTAAGTQTLHLNSRTFHLELALNSSARYQGLSDRKTLAPDAGMLFVFPESDHLGFVMRRCHIPIDVIFVDPSGHVESWHEMKVEPYDAPESRLPVYRSQWPCQFAIEIPGGTARSLALKPGQKLDLPWTELKRLAR